MDGWSPDDGGGHLVMRRGIRFDWVVLYFMII